MKDVLMLALMWIAAFAAFHKAARYPTVWAAVAASAATGTLGIYVFWLDWSLPH